MEELDLIHSVFSEEELNSVRLHPVLVALSGGADSVALLRLLLAVGCDCRALHCNFHLRGEESMRDERFVRELCERLEVPLMVRDFDVAAWQQNHGGSVEMACREMRYQWFEQERQRQQCGLIAVAHHADDQIETFFLNLMRGTGVRGLSGMKRLSGYIWRPLLGVTRGQLLHYLEAIGQDFVTDSTNAQNEYRRNRLRNSVLPIIENDFPNARARILDTMDNLNQDYSLFTTLVQQTLPTERHIPIDTLCCQPDASTLLYHRIRNLGFNRLQCGQAVEAASQARTGRQFVTDGYRLVVNRQSLDIEEINDQADVVIPVDLVTGLQSPIRMTVTRGDTPFSQLMCDGKLKVAFNSKLLNARNILLRHWRKGDRIKPFGMNGSKLVSDLFSDFKLDHADRQKAWLLEADGEIIWVVGYRASALYPVSRESQDYLLLSLV